MKKFEASARGENRFHGSGAAGKSKVLKLLNPEGCCLIGDPGRVLEEEGGMT